jgi:hypothetical protein
MNLVELTEYLVKNLVKDPENVSVSIEEDDKEKTIKVTVPEEDMAVVIGRGGKIANSIRNVVQASAYINNLGRVRINIESK